MNKPSIDQKRAYEAIVSRKEKFGVFHRTCLHLHTPASYDYCLLKDWEVQNYQDATEQNILDLCIKTHTLPGKCTLNDLQLEDEYTIFANKKEMLSYFLLANSLMDKGIEIALVSDHNTIKGIAKLELAIKEVFHMKKTIYTEVLWGVEISCADRNHVIGIFKSDAAEKVQGWLKENLIDEVQGSYKTSIDVIEFFKSIDGLSYIAHIETSDVIKESMLSGAYKRKLFDSSMLDAVGIKKLEKRTEISERLRSYRSTPIKVLLDNDAHEVDSLAERSVWIKCSKRGFRAFKEAIDDYDISISLVEPHKNFQYIKGVYIEHTERGFLSNPEGTNAFCLNFSDGLNCLIGGRGTGKSSTLELLEFALAQHCGGIERLDFLCSHGNIWILYAYIEQEYLIEFRMPVKEHEDDHILRSFGQNPSNKYYYKYTYSEESIRERLLNNHVTVYEVIKQPKDEWKLQTISNKEEFLRKFFDQRYSINALVNIASGNNLAQFIYNILFKNRVLANPQSVINCRSASGLSKVLNDIQDILARREEDVLSIVKPFNESQNGILRIVFSQEPPNTIPSFQEWLFPIDYVENSFYQNYNITMGDIVEYFAFVFLYCRKERKNQAFDFFRMIVNEDIAALESISPLNAFCTERTPRMIEAGIKELTTDTAQKILNDMIAILLSNQNILKIIAYLREYVKDSEDFALEFNINNREGGSAQKLYKRIQELSLGQKVVGMLAFILGYSEYSKDFRPLLIDQPEDNLDNQYIYRNLVKKLRDTKDKRQVIIATHNATIVTNAKADQVCVMESKDNHGWVSATGYAGEGKIKKYIINYLEGGKESFKHKIHVYSDVLD